MLLVRRRLNGLERTDGNQIKIIILFHLAVWDNKTFKNQIF